MKMRSPVVTLPLSYFAGILIILIYVIFTAVSFMNYPTSYSPLSNWLSDLGNYSRNPSGAIYYNIGMVLSGFIMVIFFIGYYKWFEGLRRRWTKILLGLAIISGVAAGVSAASVGLVSEDLGIIHTYLSIMIFLNFGDSLIFSTAALFTHPKFVRPIAYFSLVYLVVNYSLLLIVLLIMFQYMLPSYYLLEWIDIGMLLAYVEMMAYNMRKFN